MYITQKETFLELTKKEMYHVYILYPPLILMGNVQLYIIYNENIFIVKKVFSNE